MSALWKEKVSDEAKSNDAADIHVENWICPVIPLPVPKAWESGVRRNSVDHQPLFKEDMSERDVLSDCLTPSTHQWLMIGQRRAPHGKCTHNGFSCPKPKTSPSSCSPVNRKISWGGTVCSYPVWRTSRSLVGGRDLEQSHNGCCHNLSCLSVILRKGLEQLASHTVTPHWFNK